MQRRPALVTALLALDGGQIVAAVSVVLLGAIIRGFTGFGSSLVWVSGLALLLPPAEVIPVIYMLEVAASASLFPSSRHHVKRQTIGPLLAGAVIGLPLGIWILTRIDPSRMALGIGVIVLVSTLLIARGARFATLPGRGATVLTGAASGFLNGVSSASGPPVIMYFMASPTSVAESRASLIAYFGLMDVAAVLFAAGAGLVGGSTLVRFGVFLPAMFLGTALGRRGFDRVDQRHARWAAIAVLFALGAAVVVKNL